MRTDYWTAEDIEKIRNANELDNAASAELVSGIILLEYTAAHSRELVTSAPLELGKLCLAIVKSTKGSIKKLNEALKSREETETRIMKAEDREKTLNEL